MTTKTEAEAKTMWCPLGRGAFQYRAGAANDDCMVVANRAENDGPITLCLASGCMAWRWVGYSIADDGADAKGTIFRFVKEVTQGYCGLAGRPE